MGQSGATASYRGYRLQALYVLYRILKSNNKNLTFRPEGNEDFDIFDENGQLVESIQVKSYESLALSDLGKKKDDSKKNREPHFFKRAALLFEKHPSVKIKIVNFGRLGPELEGAWANKSDVDNKYRKSIAKKLTENYGLNTNEVVQVISKVDIQLTVESKIKQKVDGLLKDLLTGIDFHTAFDLFNYWIYLASESQQEFTQSLIIEKIKNIGKFLSERHAHHSVWFKAVKPIEYKTLSDNEKTRLKQEFYAGISTRYEHILAGLDFRRDELLDEIDKAFNKTNVVIIHSASGQGKTTLAYRYINEQYPDKWRFQIDVIQDTKHALEIVTALNGHANVVQAPLILYIDVRPSNTNWVEVVRQLAQNTYINILVTVREEDFRRANIPSHEFQFEEVTLIFDEKEAQNIFQRAGESQVLERFLDFESAWNVFKEEGPLLEFVYLLTQTNTLQERLRQQVDFIYQEVVKSRDIIDKWAVLRMVAVASAFEARINIDKLKAHVEKPILLSKTIKELEQEYLIRSSQDQVYVEGLHPIRSTILTNLLTDSIDRWDEIAIEVLPLLLEEDLEIFILNSLVQRSKNEQKAFISFVSEYYPNTWIGLSGIVRCLIWVSIRNYVEANWHLIDEVQQKVGKAWWVVLNFDLVNLAQDSLNENSWFWTKLGKKGQKQIQELRSQLSPKSNVFLLSQNWMSKLSKDISSPHNESDWLGVAEILFWAGYLQIGTHIKQQLSDRDLASLANYPLIILSNVSSALYSCSPIYHQQWLAKYQEKLDERLATEYKILAIEREETKIKIHFIPTSLDKTNTEESSTSKRSSDELHNATMDRFDIVRRLFPHYERYASQGYGHKFGSLKIPFDSTTKDGPIENFHLHWLPRINRIAIGIADNNYRPDTWYEYINDILTLRQLVVEHIKLLQQGLTKFIKSRRATTLIGQYWNDSQTQNLHIELNGSPPFPKQAVDKWGFLSEKNHTGFGETFAQNQYIPKAIALRKYKPYFDAQHKYFSPLSNFFNQATHVILLNEATRHVDFNNPNQKPLLTKKAILDKAKELGVKDDFKNLSVRNYWNALQALTNYQKEFRLLFAHRIDNSSLLQLEQDEQTILSETWELWYFFAHKPHQRYPNPSQTIPRSIKNVKEKLDQKFAQGIELTNSFGIQASRIKTDLCWENSPALWVQYNVDNPINFYKAFEQIVNSLRNQFDPNDYQSLNSYLIEKHYIYIVIIPLVQGKSLDNNCFPLKILVTILSNKSIEEAFYLYSPQPLSTTFARKLNIELWQNEEVQHANNLATALHTLRLIIVQLANFSKLPQDKLSEVSIEVLSNYISDQSPVMQDALNEFKDVGEILLEKIQSLDKEQLQSRAYLQEALLNLKTISDFVLMDESNGIKLKLDELSDYAQGLEQCSEAIEAVRLLWIADVVQNQGD